jgi:tetratricopeptide (TPR) repeat protein
LVPRALLASASDLAAVGELGDAAALLEKYAAGFQRERAMRKWRAAHPAKKAAKKPEPERPAYEEAKAQVALHDAAVLREARGELRQALSDRALSLQLWKSPSDRDDQLFAQAKLRAGLGETSRAAREMADIARSAKGKPALQLTAWREAARLFAKVHETGNAQWSWTEAERIYRALPQKARESLPADAVAAAAEAHFALGQQSFESFRKQEIRQPLMATLNRKIALLQAVRKRAEETVAMRQAEPAVCALAQLGEAQMMLGQAIATSPYPPGLNADQRKLYRDALAEKAHPLSVEARETLKSADARARELGVNGPCTQRVGALLEKLAARAADRPQMTLARSPVVDTPVMVDGRAVQTERAKRLLGEALSAAKGLDPEQAVEKFQAAAQAEPSPATHFDLAVALDRAGHALEAEQEYRAAGTAKGALGYEAAARAASLAAARGDAQAARSALALSDAAMPGIVAGRVLRAELELALGNASAAQAAARAALAQAPNDVRALCAMARAVLAQGQPGAARIFAARAERADATDPEPLLVKAAVARASGEPSAELAAVRAAVEVAPDAPQAQLALGRALYERGDVNGALNALEDAIDLDPASFPAMLAYGQALAQAGQAKEAEEALERAVALAPRAPEPHLELARLKLDGDGDAQSALREAKLFLSLSTNPPPPGHPVHVLVQRCEEALKQASQASVVQTK